MDPNGIMYAGPLGLGFPELVVIAGLALLLFGGKKVGDLGKGLGEGIRNFKTALKSDDENTNANTNTNKPA
ncbi:MAG TPA: twin-arginine translocase TatA/TatE family subunit [Bryobacteraceae bacterium]|jgi:sec-independent protein translocase protein TatA|nr:twin-arginine translocase TatA/TatE family subunit [Bryobacteraceae bacterium]